MHGFVAGDGGSRLVVVCRDHDSQQPINLAGKTVQLRFRINAGTVAERSMTITDAAAGKAEYVFASSELLAGLLTAEVRLNPGLSDQLTSIDELSIPVRAPL